MNKADLESFREQLLHMRTELEELDEAERESTAPVKLDQTSVGRVSRMDAMQSQQMAKELGRRRQNALVKVEEALYRMETGEYGYCLACNADIDPRRLAADPTNSLCIRCAAR